MNKEIRMFCKENICLRVTKDDSNKEFLIETGYANLDKFSLLKAYPFAGWETWNEIEPVAEAHLKMACSYQRLRPFNVSYP